MSIQDIAILINTYGVTGILIAIACSIVLQVSRIPINPYSYIFKWIGHQLTKDVEARIMDLDNRITKMDADNKANNADSMRWVILDYGNSCRNGRKHSKEEWAHALKCLDRYHRYITDNGLVNGEIDLTDIYLRELYSETLKSNDFLN